MQWSLVLDAVLTLSKVQQNKPLVPACTLSKDNKCFRIVFVHVWCISKSLCLFLPLVSDSLPPARYKETISTLLAWLQQCEAKLAIPSTAVTEYPIMEQRLKDVQVHTHSHPQTRHHTQVYRWVIYSSCNILSGGCVHSEVVKVEVMCCQGQINVKIYLCIFWRQGILTIFLHPHMVLKGSKYTL